MAGAPHEGPLGQGPALWHSPLPRRGRSPGTLGLTMRLVSQNLKDNIGAAPVPQQHSSSPLSPFKDGAHFGP